MNPSARRRAVLDQLGDGVLVLVAPPERTRSNDTQYLYRPGSDILYLTGFPEPETVVVLAPNHPEHQFVMFVRPRNRDSEIWDGFRYGPEGAMREFGADAAFPIGELDERLPGYLRDNDTLHYALGEDRAFDDRILGMLRALGASRKQPNRAPTCIRDPRPLLHRMRMVKSEHELGLLARACEISATAHVEAMKATRPGLREFEIQAVLEGSFLRQGAAAPAYASIVAGGANACVLHYVANRDELRDGELLLVDAGAEVDWYAGDITRTWPVGRTFSPEQRAVYEAVLDAEEYAVDMVRPCASKHDIGEKTTRRLTQSMIDIGLLSGSLDEAMETEAYRRYYMHGIGHYLGLDVHDVGVYFVSEGQGEPFVPGVVTTIEPGIYVAPDDLEAPEAFRGIGVRIEDDVVVTDGEPRVLTGGVPKSIAEIEALRAEALD